MKTVGIVCEFNPFHYGHQYLIDTVKKEGASVVCVMSGNFVQRGEPAILPASFRAAAALRGGADAVFELPFPWSSASAEGFAGAAVYLLSRLGCDAVAFGSESADIAFLSDEASRAVPAKSEPGSGTAGVYPRLSPNDILGVEYIRAARRLGYGCDFIAVSRVGAPHGSTDADTLLPSSSAIRAELLRGVSVGESLPECSLSALRAASDSGECPATSDSLGGAMLGFWRLCDPAHVCRFAECGGGVAQRLHKAALDAAGYDGLISLSATKKYTTSRLRRAALFGMLEVLPDDIKRPPSYTRLLAAGREGRSVVKEASAGGTLCVVTKKRDVPDTPGAARQAALAARADALYGLALPRPAPAGRFIREKCEISDGN